MMARFAYTPFHQAFRFRPAYALMVGAWGRMGAPQREGGVHMGAHAPPPSPPTALLPPLPHLACPGLLGQDGILLQLVVGEHVLLHSLAAGVVTGQEVPGGRDQKQGGG